MAPQYERALSSRWITGEPSRFSKTQPMDELLVKSPSFYKDTTADYYYKNSVIEIMFYMKHSCQLIKQHLKQYYDKYVHLMPFAASSLLSVRIFIFDNINNKYIEKPTNNHQWGFDGENMVKFCEDSKLFLTSHRYIFCSSGTEIMLDEKMFNHLINIYDKDNIKKPNIISVQGVPGCGKSTWIINNHKLGWDLVLCATKEGLADIKSKVSERCIKEGADFNKIEANYKTIASYLINGCRNYETVFIDEYLMVYAGYIGLVSI